MTVPQNAIPWFATVIFHLKCENEGNKTPFVVLLCTKQKNPPKYHFTQFYISLWQPHFALTMLTFFSELLKKFHYSFYSHNFFFLFPFLFDNDVEMFIGLKNDCCTFSWVKFVIIFIVYGRNLFFAVVSEKFVHTWFLLLFIIDMDKFAHFLTFLLFDNFFLLLGGFWRRRLRNW